MNDCFAKQSLIELKISQEDFTGYVYFHLSIKVTHYGINRHRLYKHWIFHTFYHPSPLKEFVH